MFFKLKNLAEMATTTSLKKMSECWRTAEILKKNQLSKYQLLSAEIRWLTSYRWIA
jgi:hypothetical protein